MLFEALLRSGSINGPFPDIYDFVERNDLHQINRKNFEGLAVAGALDCFKTMSRSQYLETIDDEDATFIEQLIKYGNQIQYETKYSTTKPVRGSQFHRHFQTRDLRKWAPGRISPLVSMKKNYLDSI